jgi:hypothetical protein
MSAENVHKCKPQARLTETEAIEIFKSRGPNQSASSVCRRFGVSEKTVRDIWKGRTWAKETWHLDTSRVIKNVKVGRPVGCRDTKPRNKKVVSLERVDGNSGISQGTTPHKLPMAPQTDSGLTSNKMGNPSIDEELYELELAGLWLLVAFQEV